MSVLSAELRAWLKPGLAGMIAVADATGQPEAARFWALRPEPTADTLVVYVQRGSAARFLEIVGNGARVALNAVEVTTYRSRMFKGNCQVAGSIDVGLLEASLDAAQRAFTSVGLAPDAAERLLGRGTPARDMVALRLVVDSVFDQSPKPGAGGRL